MVGLGGAPKPPTVPPVPSPNSGCTPRTPSGWDTAQESRAEPNQPARGSASTAGATVRHPGAGQQSAPCRLGLLQPRAALRRRTRMFVPSLSQGGPSREPEKLKGKKKKRTQSARKQADKSEPCQRRGVRTPPASGRDFTFPRREEGTGALPQPSRAQLCAANAPQPPPSRGTRSGGPGPLPSPQPGSPAAASPLSPLPAQPSSGAPRARPGPPPVAGRRAGEAERVERGGRAAASGPGERRPHSGGGRGGQGRMAERGAAGGGTRAPLPSSSPSPCRRAASARSRGGGAAVRPRERPGRAARPEPCDVSVEPELYGVSPRPFEREKGRL